MKTGQRSELKSLCEQYSKFFYIGAAVDCDRMDHYKAIIDRHFNSITPENSMKFNVIHPEADEFDWQGADAIVSYALNSGKIVRGHTLLWHQQLPNWVFSSENHPICRESLLRIMEKHICEIVSRYKGKVNIWDVVNEALSDDIGFFRSTSWLDVIGEDYIKKAFCFAREANPDAKLFYNDFNGNKKDKQDRIFELIRGMKKENVPVDGVGIQAHYNIFYPELDDIKREIERYSKLGVRIHITELDISVFDFSDGRKDMIIPSYEQLQRQEEMYYRIFEIYRQYNDVIDNVTLWGVADDYTWLDNYPVSGRKDWPLLFDEQLKAKNVLNRVMDIR